MKYRKTQMHPKYPVTKASSYGKILWSWPEDGEMLSIVKWYESDGKFESIEKCKECWIEPIGGVKVAEMDIGKCSSIW